MGELVRLQRYLASAGVAARRKAEELITAGRVTVNGEVVTTLGTKVDPDTAEVTVDGEAVMAHDKFYVLLNKPKACITAVTDDRGRPTVMDYLPNVPVPVKPVGRLDFYSEGVLLLTNDGELAAKLLAPASHVAKTYHVKVHGQLSNDEVKRLREGVTLDDGTETMPAEIEVLPGESKHTWLAITIHEGKHRQIHRMVEALGYAVDKLQRVAFANLTFHNLRVGDARELTQMELNQLRDLVGLDHSPVARGRWRSDREATDIPRRARAKAREEAEAAAVENEENRLRNEAARATSGGDAWDGEGDPDRDPDGEGAALSERFLPVDDDDQRGAPLPQPSVSTAPTPKPRGKGKPYESRAVGRRDPDAARAPRGGRDDRPSPRGAREDRPSPRGAPGRGGARALPPGQREVRQYSDRAPSARSEGPRSDGPRGGARSEGPRGGARSEGPRGGARSEGPRGGFGARSEGPRGGARSDGPRGGARSEGPRGGFGARSEGPRGGARSDGPRGGARSEGPRGGSFARSEGPRGGARSEGPRGGVGARSDGPRGGARSEGPRGGARSEGPRGGFGARSDGPRGGARSEGPRGGARSEGPRGGARSASGPSGGPRGQGRSFGKNAGKRR